jgi:hypothetical protein
VLVTIPVYFFFFLPNILALSPSYLIVPSGFTMYVYSQVMMCLAKTRSTFEITKMHRGRVTCYMGPAGAVMGQTRFSVGTIGANVALVIRAAYSPHTRLMR